MIFQNEVEQVVTLIKCHTFSTILIGKSNINVLYTNFLVGSTNNTSHFSFETISYL